MATVYISHRGRGKRERDEMCKSPFANPFLWIPHKLQFIGKLV